MMSDDEGQLQRDEVFRVGKVISVEGRRVRIAVDKLKNSSHLLYKGEIVRNVSVGSYVKITKGFNELIAVVEGERVQEDRAISKNYSRTADALSRALDVSLMGYLEDGEFKRGVREMPLLDNECFILSEPEFEAIHTFVREGESSLSVGTLAMEPTQAVNIGVNGTFASHVGIFGNTGSGKSYTLAKLYHELLGSLGNQPGFVDRSRFILLDFNGEYVNSPGDISSSSVVAAQDLKQEYRLSTRSQNGDRLPLPRSAVHDPAFWNILLDATERTQAPFVSRVLRGDYWDRLLPDASSLLAVIADSIARATKSTDPSMDRTLPLSFLEEIQDCLGSGATSSFDELVQDFATSLGYHSANHNFYWQLSPGRRKWSSDDDWSDFIANKIIEVDQDFSNVGDVDLVRFKLILQFYRDVIGGFVVREHIGPLMKRLDERIGGIKRLIRVADHDLASKPLTVVSLRDVNLDMRKVLPMILCKHLYEEKKSAERPRDTYLNLIIDEAHNILSFDSSRESEAWRDYRLETFEEIIKEGRKFGVFLTIASQRPHDISPTIISQLHNYFLHRLVNDLDIRAIQKAVAYLDSVSFESLPILPTGVCILAGVSAQVPVMMQVGALEPEFEPNSRTMSLTDAWSSPLDTTQRGKANTDVNDHDPPF